MNKLNFTEQDKQKVVDFLNYVATHAEFTLKTQELISYFKLLAFMQQELLPKIDANILEIKRVIETPASEEEKKGKTKK